MENNAFFLKPWIFLQGAPSEKFLPVQGPKEIAFSGRSNVGKSSLINTVLQQKSLARTSNTPGRTQELNFFIPDLKNLAFEKLPLAIVDMPGYGFAQAPKEKVNSWTNFIFSYLRGRTTLKRVYVLIDSRHGIKKTDLPIMDLLDKAAISYQVILTKIDKINDQQIKKLEKETYDFLKKRPASFPEILMTSSAKGIGIDSVRSAILSLLDQ